MKLLRYRSRFSAVSYQIRGRSPAPRCSSLVTANCQLTTENSRSESAHSRHAAHASHSSHATHVVVVVVVVVFRLTRLFNDDRVGGHQQAGDAGSVLQRGPNDLRRVDDSRLEHVAVAVIQGVVAISL